MRLLYRAATSVVNRNGVASPIYEQLLSSLVFLAQHDILRTDNLLAGKLILPFLGEAARHSGNRPETVRLHRGIGVHHHPGTAFGIIPEWRSASTGFLSQDNNAPA